MLCATRQTLQTVSLMQSFIGTELGAIGSCNCSVRSFSSKRSKGSLLLKAAKDRERKINRPPLSPVDPEIIARIQKSLVDHRKEQLSVPGKHITDAEKRKFLVRTLLDLKDGKQAIYGTLDAWVSWEEQFPLTSLKKAIFVLQKREEWHRVIQVVKWMLSKGQGSNMGTYELLIRALEKDNRAEEAHRIWNSKIGSDVVSIPWRFCDLMLSIYYRNNMLQRLISLFKRLEAYGRKPPSKAIVQKAVDACEMLGRAEEKNRILVKYKHLYTALPIQ